MLTALLALVSLPQAQFPPKPADLVSKMMDHYSQANTLSGKLTYTQTAQGPDETGKMRVYTAQGETDVQVERPNKIYVLQVMDGHDDNMNPTKVKSRIVSNGSRFLYAVPMKFDVPYEELRENVNQGGQQLNVADIYNIGGSGLIIKPAPLDVVIGRTEDLKLFRDQIVSLDDEGRDTVNGQPVRIIGGDWREYASAPPSAKYQLAITDSGDLLRYTTKEKVADPSGKIQPVDVTTVWNVDIKVNGPVDESLFKDKDLAPPNGKKPGSN